MKWKLNENAQWRCAWEYNKKRIRAFNQSFSDNSHLAVEEDGIQIDDEVWKLKKIYILQQLI